VFFADAHLGMPGEEPGHAEKVAAFLRRLRGRTGHLYIVGDLFDFWFEYGSVVPNTAPHVVFELYNLVRSGTPVTLFGGNHDYWLGSYLSESVGVRIVTDGLAVEHQGRSIYMHHGDGLYPDDRGYRMLKRVLRNPVSIFLFRLLHPDLARKIASLSSKVSRNHVSPPESAERHKELLRKIADARLGSGYDAVVYGHSHIPLVEQREKGTLVLLGDWITHDTYVVLENGEFTLHEWNETPEAGNG